jgi:hypothetical protein
MCLFFGTHVDDKLGATSDGERLFKKWFVPEMNRKFIPNAEPIHTFDFTAGVDFHYKAKGKITPCHESSINKFIADNDLQGLAPTEFPCTPELYKKVMAAPQPSTDAEKEAMRRIRSAYLKYLGWAAHIARTTAPWVITSCTVAASYMAGPSKVHFALVIQVIAHMKWVVANKKWHAITRPRRSGTPKQESCMCISPACTGGRRQVKATRHGLFLVWDIPLHGFRKKQKCIALNTCESVFMAMSQAGQPDL